MMDCDRLKMLEKYDYFKLKSKRLTKNKYSIYKLLQIHHEWSQSCKKNLLNYDDINKDPVLHKSVDAFIQKAFSHVSYLSADNDAHIQANTDQKNRNAKDVTPKEFKKTRETKKNKLPHRKSHCLSSIKENKAKGLLLDNSIDSKCKIQAPIPKNIFVRNQNIKSQIENSTSDKFSKVIPKSYALKSSKKTQDGNLFSVAQDTKKELHCTPDKKLNQAFPLKEITLKSNVDKQKKSLKKKTQPKSLSQLTPENKTKTALESNYNFKKNVLSMTDYSKSCSRSSAINKNHCYQGNDSNAHKQEAQLCIKKSDELFGKQNVTCEQMETTIPKQVSQNGEHAWHTATSLEGTEEHDIRVPFAPFDSDPLWQEYPVSYDIPDQFGPLDYFNWDTTCNFHPYSSDSLKFLYDENTNFWGNQWTPILDNFHHYPTTKDIDANFERNYHVNEHYETYFRPAEAILHSRLSNGTDLASSQTKTEVSSSGLRN